MERMCIMKKLLTICAVLILLTGCKPATPIEPPAETSTGTPSVALFTAEEFARIDGSTVTIPLTQLMAEKVAGMNPAQAATLTHNRTNWAYNSLINGDCDIIFVTSPSEDEYGYAEDAGIEYEIVPIVRDAFVFLVNTDNPVNNLTNQQILDIYTGKTTNWSQVGGTSLDIIPYQRQENSGSQTGMLDLVMKDTPIMDAPTEYKPAEMGGLIENIASFDSSKAAIGYSYYYYASSMYLKDTVKLLAIDGVSPENSTVASQQYPYTTAYYAVIRSDEPEGSFARRMIAYLLSDDGQALAEEAGYVPLN